MSDRPQNIQVRLGDIPMYLCHSNFVKTLRSIYTKINQLFEQILTQGKNQNLENKKGNNLSTKSGQESLGGNNLPRQGTNKGGSSRVKKVGPVPNSTLKNKEA